MSKRIYRLGRPLRYTISCAGCRADIRICPEELNERLAVCPSCKLPNRTPVYALLAGHADKPLKH